MRRSYHVLLTALLLLGGCTHPLTSEPAPPPAATPAFSPVAVPDTPGLHNVFRLTDRLYSGSGPDGEEGFRSIAALGVKTVITVDGSAPDVKTAERFGLRYVHLPIGYDGVPRETAVRIARAVRDLPGPVYLHCHHGMHRGPAAAMAAVRCLDDRCPAAAALDFLHAAGTDPAYKGLFASVTAGGAATPAELDRAGGDFPAVAPVADLVRMMVAVDERWNRMKAVRAAGWTMPTAHPDLDPPHEARLLREHFREAARLSDVAKRPDGFRQRLTASEAAAEELERLLREKSSVQVRERADAVFKRLSAGCADCHRTYRDGAK
jgi:protein tyrosine phosphatase (PTP) superfamily phosphohydrolase (DUF442 family)